MSKVQLPKKKNRSACRRTNFKAVRDIFWIEPQVVGAFEVHVQSQEGQFWVRAVAQISHFSFGLRVQDVNSPTLKGACLRVCCTTRLLCDILLPPWEEGRDPEVRVVQ